MARWATRFCVDKRGTALTAAATHRCMPCGTCGCTWAALSPPLRPQTARDRPDNRQNPDGRDRSLLSRCPKESAALAAAGDHHQWRWRKKLEQARRRAEKNWRRFHCCIGDTRVSCTSRWQPRGRPPARGRRWRCRPPSCRGVSESADDPRREISLSWRQINYLNTELSK